MTEKTSRDSISLVVCPLCRKVMKKNDNGYFVCFTIDCFIVGKGWSKEELSNLDSQISAIRQKAKQEFVNEIDSEMNIASEVYNKIKKKHGVE